MQLEGLAERVLFPAHAGVILRQARRRRGLRAIPRPRGGDPDIADLLIAKLAYSPPTRG